MTVTEVEVINFFQVLLNTIPQYVLGVLPAIAILGSSPENGLINKFLYLFCSLGSPFSGLFYYLNVKNEKLKMSLYWLEPGNFVKKENLVSGESNPKKLELKYKPFGCHAKKIILNDQQRKIIEECAAETSILDRFSPLVPIYYIIIGIFAAISRAFGPCEWVD